MNITEFRKQYPQYNDMSDEALANSFHEKYYNDMPYSDFSKKFGVSVSNQDQQNAVTKPKMVDTFLGKLPQPEKGKNIFEDETRQQVNNSLQGTKQGLYDVGDLGNKFWLSIANSVGADKNLPVGYDDYRSMSDADAKSFENSEAGNSLQGKVGRFIGSSWPYMFVPGGQLGKISTVKDVLKPMLTGSTAMGGIGLVQDIANQNKFPINTLLGGAAGSLTPPLLAAGGYGINLAKKPLEWASNFINPEKQILRKTADIMGDDVSNAITTKEAAQRAGLQLTPAEASGNPLLAQMQGSAGTSESGANKLYAFGKQHVEQQRNAIDDVLSTITSNPKAAAGDIRQAAKQSIEKQKQALIDKASPYYKLAEKDIIPMGKFNILMKDPIILDAYRNIVNDPIYKKALAGVQLNSVQYLNEVKKFINENSKSLYRAGKDYSSLITNSSAKSITDFADKISPSYKQARNIYSEDAPALGALKNSPVGKIANLKDMQLKNTSKIILDPAQTDIKVMANMRDRIASENPTAWNQIVRNEMERRLDKSGGTGNDFYSKILKGNRDFNQFSEAVKNIPGAQQKLADLKLAFKNLINPVTPKTAASLAKSSLDVPRSTSQMVKNVVDNVLGGRYDNALIDFITNPNWDKKILDFMKQSPKKFGIGDKANMFINTFEKIGIGNMNLKNNNSSDMPLVNQE